MFFTCRMIEFALFDKFPVSKGNLRYFIKYRNTTFLLCAGFDPQSFNKGGTDRSDIDDYSNSMADPMMS